MDLKDRYHIESESSKFFRERAERCYRVELSGIEGSDLKGKHGSSHFYRVYPLPEGPVRLLVLAQVWGDLSVSLMLMQTKKDPAPVWCDVDRKAPKGVVERSGMLTFLVGRVVSGEDFPWVTQEVKQALAVALDQP